MGSMNPRRPPWKALAVVAAVLLVLIGGFFAWVQVVADRRWAALEKRVPELIAEARARDPRRPVLRGEAVPGSAWTDYNPALAAIKGLKSSDLGDWVSRAPAADRSKAEAAVAAHAGSLALLRAGVRKAEGAYPYAFEKGFSADLPGLLQSQNLVHLAVTQARFLAEAGRRREAVELLLDASWFAADLGRNTVLIAEMISWALLSSALDELRALLGETDSKDLELAELGRALAVLEGLLPSHAESMLNEAASATAGLTDAETEGLGLSDGIGRLSAWRYGFSGRLMIADAADAHLRFMRRSAASGPSWAEIQRVQQELFGEVVAQKNPIVRILVPGLLSSHKTGFERRAQLRLLRAAVALRAGGPMPELEDPFGGKLRTDGAKLWSRGQDGVDGGGVGAWKPERTGDIVLELKP